MPSFSVSHDCEGSSGSGEVTCHKLVPHVSRSVPAGRWSPLMRERLMTFQTQYILRALRRLGHCNTAISTSFVSGTGCFSSLMDGEQGSVVPASWPAALR